MPPELEKIAGLGAAGSYDDVVKILKNISASGKKLGDTPENIAKKILIGEDGQTHSFILDAIKFPINKTQFGKNMNKNIGKFKRNFIDIDMRAGKKIHDYFISKNSKLFKKIGNAFVENQQVHIKNPAGIVDEAIDIPIAALSRPIDKTKNAVLPIAGSFAIVDTINKNGKKEGDTVKTSYTREELIEKIATLIENNKKSCEDKKENETKKLDSENKEIIKKASTALKVAAQKIRELEVFNEKLALENQRLYLENIERKKLDEATKLAYEMNNKGLIKKADIENKITELFSMDDQSLEMLKTAISNISLNNMQKDGIDSLTFVVDNNNINYRKTLADSINEAANEIR